MLVVLDAKIFYDSMGGQNPLIEELMRVLFIYNSSTRFLILAKDIADAEKARRMFNTSQSFRVETMASAMNYLDFVQDHLEHIDILFTKRGGRVFKDVGAVYYSD